MSATLRGHPFAVLVPFAPSVMLVVYPLLDGVWLGFTDHSPIYPDTRWIGVENDAYRLTDPLFWEVW